jgi:membrane associated rhomboid family serine protease
VARRNPDFTRILTFGGRVPAAVGGLIGLMFVASVLGWLNRGLMGLVALAPVAIQRGELWRLVTWPFFQDDPFTLLFGGFMIWTFGQQLSYSWSERRFATRFLGYTIGAGLLSTLLGLVWDDASAISHVGVWPVANALLVAWAMLYPDRQVNIWGVLPLTGKTLALLVTGGTALYAIAGGFPRGFAVFAPHLFAIGIAWFQGRPRGARRPGFSSQAKRWWTERENKKRAKHLKVVRKDGPDDRSQWLN